MEEIAETEPQVEFALLTSGEPESSGNIHSADLLFAVEEIARLLHEKVTEAEGPQGLMGLTTTLRALIAQLLARFDQAPHDVDARVAAALAEWARRPHEAAPLGPGLPKGRSSSTDALNASAPASLVQ